MNRIRVVNDKYQVLLNQNYRTNPAIELTLGSLLTQEYLRDYEVKEFNTMNDAMNLAFSLPPIDFNKIRSDCVDCFKMLNNQLTHSLRTVICDLKPHLLTPEDIKNAIFDRVINYGRRFNFYNFNDVIAFDVIVNYQIEMSKIIDLILMNKKFRIIRKEQTPSHVKLIGLTENNISYEIRIWTHQMHDLMYWIFRNNKNPYEYKEEIARIIRQQDENDKVLF